MRAATAITAQSTESTRLTILPKRRQPDASRVLRALRLLISSTLAEAQLRSAGAEAHFLVVGGQKWPAREKFERSSQARRTRWPKKRRRPVLSEPGGVGKLSISLEHPWRLPGLLVTDLSRSSRRRSPTGSGCCRSHRQTACSGCCQPGWCCCRRTSRSERSGGS